jgi:uncharacterized protein
MKIEVEQLYIYPVKSMGGFSVQEAMITDRGFAHDRRWMVVDNNGRFLTQRELPRLAQIATEPSDKGFALTDMRTGERLELPWELPPAKRVTVRVWNDTVQAIGAPPISNAWLSERLDRAVQLVYMPPSAHRPLDIAYATGVNSFSDAFPFVFLSSASVQDLNGRLVEPVTMDRFRPNVVVAGGEAYQEDAWKDLNVGQAHFRLVRPCARCTITTIDQRSALRGQEPLRTLATYRSVNNQVLFAMNAVAVSGDRVRVGDPITPLSWFRKE